MENSQTNSSLPQRRPSVTVVLSIAVLSILGYLVLSPALSATWNISSNPKFPGVNTALAEADAWREGKLSLDHDFYEDARVGDKTYNVTGTAFAFIAYCVISVTDLISNSPTFPTWIVMTIMIGVPTVVVLLSFRRIVNDELWASLFCLAFIAGTPFYPVMLRTSSGSIYYINHVIAVVGLCLMATDILGKCRLWPGAIGLMLASWSRQMTILYAIPLIWIALTSLRTPIESQKKSVGALAAFSVFLAITVGVPATLNTLKFGSPFESGYSLIYEGRTDPVARRGQQALFSIDYVWMHAKAMNFDLPTLEVRHSNLHLDTTESLGTSIWITSPFTIAVLLTIRGWWGDPKRRALMLGTIPVICGLMMYHTTGAEAGFYRYALDFLPVWWIVAAPFAIRSPNGRRWSTVAIFFGVCYYQLLDF